MDLFALPNDFALRLIENVSVQGLLFFSDRKPRYFLFSSPEGCFGIFGFAVGRVLSIS
ncbi:uncharacterized protein METZ01_LOCUS99437, partial [marine metagenome]